MGLTPFLVAAGVGAGHIGGTGLALESSVGGPVNREAMELLLRNGANVNDRVTGTRTYSMRVSRAPSANEGRTALHIAAQNLRPDVVRYLLDKGANPAVEDAGGLKPIDLLPAVQSATANSAIVSEIRSLLQSAGRN
jgi:ankyrin repeat protein